MKIRETLLALSLLSVWASACDDHHIHRSAYTDYCFPVKSTVFNTEEAPGDVGEALLSWEDERVVPGTWLNGMEEIVNVKVTVDHDHVYFVELSEESCGDRWEADAIIFLTTHSELLTCEISANKTISSEWWSFSQEMDAYEAEEILYTINAIEHLGKPVYVGVQTS